MKNNDNNLDETKVFKAVDNNADDDTLQIPSFNSSSTEDTVVMEPINDDGELVDNSSDNLKAAEEELNNVLKQQSNGNNGDGDDPDMAKKKKKFSKLEKFNIFLLSSFSLMVIGGLGALIFFISLLNGNTDLDLEALINQKKSVIYDRNDEPIFDTAMYSGDGATYSDIHYIDMSQSIVDAFVSIEDSRFFKHPGFDIPRFTKAAFANLTRPGSQGGSTLTMQLIKTSQLNPDKTWSRKAQEIVLSLKLDNALTKDQTFEYYVNKINYGAGNTRGLEGAAQYYFNKSASELNLPESALLAGVVNKPGWYNPIKNLDLAYERREDVLKMMVYHGYISETEYDLAMATKIENQLTKENLATSSTEENPYLDFVNAVIDEVKDTLDVDIIATPMNIYTTMDSEIQKTIADIQHERNYTYPDHNMQSAIVIGDNDTGEVLGIGGGRDGQVMKGFNRATDMYQQPGSVTKPLLSYALAFEHLGWATSHVVEDRPVQYAGTNKYLANFDGRYRGEVTLKDALANSLNTPAYLTLLDVQDEIGSASVAQYLRDLGFSKVTNEQYNTQYAIGGSTFQASPLELFGAQAVMMNGGYYIEPHTVRYVETPSNEIIEDKFEKTKTQVISPESAYLVSVLENNNVNNGAAFNNRMNILGGRSYPVYAKTGTTDYADTAIHLGIPEGAGKDQWMFASSRKYSSVVWMGWDKPEAGETTWWTGPKYSANPLGKMNNILLDAVHAGKDNPGKVERPSGISDITHVLSTFPYANPIADMDPAYITSGEINSKYLKLVDLEHSGVNIEAMTDGFSASYNPDNGQLVINWPEYPEDGAIKGATYTMTAGSISATGTRLFDPSWIFGPVTYRAEIRQDGAVYDSVDSESNSTTQTVNFGNGTTIEVCGWYGNSQQNGERKCVSVSNPKKDETITLNIKTERDIDLLVSQYGLNRADFVKIDNTITSDMNQHGLVAGLYYNNRNVNGNSYTESQLKTMKFTYSLYEYKEDKPEEPEEPGKPDKPDKPSNP